MNYEPLFAPMYRLRAVDVVLTPEGTGAEPVTLRAIDKSSGVELEANERGSRQVAVSSLRPVAQIRASDLADAGLDRDAIRKASLTMNGRTWRVERTIPRPTLQGADDGQLWLVLSEI